VIVIKLAIVFCAIVLLSAASGRAQAPPSKSATEQSEADATPFKLSLAKSQPQHISRFEKAPIIDGNLNEQVWLHAVVLKDFYQTQPGDNLAPSYPTELLLGYDSKNLYIAFRAFDDPSQVRATVAKRDDVQGDDTVQIYLDTFDDRRRAYFFFFNPFGVQQDGILTEGTGEDYSLDVVLESKGTVTDFGYAVEAAIPFSSLRYEAGKGKLWGIQSIRRIKHANNEQNSWMPLFRDKSGFLSQEGHITGLEGISTERTLEFIPSVTISETGKRVRAFSLPALNNNPLLVDPGRFVNQPIALDPGLTAKFGISPSITLDLALNPDFAQVEADQTVVTVNQRFPIFFEEKRPFFLEGADIFQTRLRVVNTRAIIDPDLAVKLSGKRGRNTFGLMVATDNGPGSFSGDERLDPTNFKFLDKNAAIGILRLKRDIGPENSIGLIATSYSFIERHNTVGGVDGRFRLNPQSTFTFQLLGTTSRRFFRDPDLGREVYRTGNALGYVAELIKSTRHVYVDLLAFGRTRDYRADVGFTNRTNSNSAELYLQYRSTPKPKAKFISWTIGNYNAIQYDWKNRIQGWNAGSRTTLNFTRQTSIGFGFDNYYERLFEEEFGVKRTTTRQGAFFGNDSERSANNKSIFFSGSTTPSKKYSASISGNYNFGAFDLDFGAGPKFPRVSAVALEDPSAPIDPGPGNGVTLTSSFTYQPTDLLRVKFDYTKSRLVRNDTGRVAFDDNIFSLHSTYQFTRFTFARARIDYDSIAANIRAQFLLGWTPNPGTSLFIGYNDDANRNGINPFTGQFEPGFRRNGRTFFIKMSYLFRHSF